MNYIYLSSSFNQDPMVMEASDAQFRVWANLFAHCHRQDNDGKIFDYKRWTDEMWSQIGCKSRAFLEAESPLWHISGEVIIVHLFNHEKQAAWNAQKINGHIFGKMGKGIPKSPRKLKE